MCNMCDMPSDAQVAALGAVVDQQLARANEGVDVIVGMASKILPTVDGNTTHAFAFISASFIAQASDFDQTNATQLFLLDNMVAAALQLAKLKAAGYTLIEEMPAL